MRGGGGRKTERGTRERTDLATSSSNDDEFFLCIFYFLSFRLHFNKRNLQPFLIIFNS